MKRNNIANRLLGITQETEVIFDDIRTSNCSGEADHVLANFLVFLAEVNEARADLGPEFIEKLGRLMQARGRFLETSSKALRDEKAILHIRSIELDDVESFLELLV